MAPYYRRVAPLSWNGIRHSGDQRRAAADLLRHGSPVAVLDAAGHTLALELFAVSYALRMRWAGPVSYVTITEPMLARQRLTALRTQGNLPIPEADTLHCDIYMSEPQAFALVQEILSLSNTAPDGYRRVPIPDLKHHAAAFAASGLLTPDPTHWLWS